MDSLKQIIETTSDEFTLMRTLNDYAYHLLRIKPDTSIHYAEKAQRLAEKLENNVELSSAFNTMALAYQTKGQFKLSIDYFNKAIEVENTSEIDKAKLYHNIGLVLRNEGKDKDALDYELKAIKILELHNDSLVLGVVYQSLCNIYRDLGDFKPAEEYVLKSIKIYENIKQQGIDNIKSFHANSYSTYGNLLQVMGRLNEAVENHKKGIAIHNESGDYYNQAIAYENLGDDYLLLKNYDESIINYNHAMQLMQQVNSGTGVGYELLKIASVYIETENYSAALQNLDSAAQVFKANNADVYLMEVYEEKYKVYDKMNNAALALENYKQFNNLKDSLNSESQQNELLRLKEEFETTQKEQQIALLETENALKDKEKSEQIILRNIAIGIIALILVIGLLLRNRSRITQQVKQLQMRNNIAIDLHDEVGSSLSSIKMLSEIAALQKDNTSNLDEILQKINSNAKETAEKMHDIIWMINPKHDLLENIIQRMEKFLYEMCSAKNIDYTFNKNISSDIKLTMQQRKDTLLIFKEAVNNAAKYSGATRIDASIDYQQNQLILKVIDNGAGFDIDTIQPGNGLDSMQMRAKELHAKLNIHSELQKGTEIILQYNC